MPQPCSRLQERAGLLQGDLDQIGGRASHIFLQVRRVWVPLARELKHYLYGRVRVPTIHNIACH